MWTPNTISEWLDERMDFIKNTLSSINKISAKNIRQMSDYTLAIQNFEYCKKLHLEFLQDSNNNDVKKCFQNIANKLILDTVYELDKQEYKCVYIHGCCFPTKDKDILPQESIDNITKMRVALENIFCQVQQLCGGKKV